MSKTKKAIIIGAGPAGLTAAYKMLTEYKDCEVIILEESEIIGGISKTIKYKNYRMDIGGHRFFSKNKEIVNFWKELMPIQGYPSYDDKILGIKKDFDLNGPNPEKEDKVLLKRNRVSRIYYLKKFFDYPITLNLITFKNMGLKRTIKVGFSYLKSIILKKEENNLEDFYINRFGKQLYEMFFEKYTEKLWGRHPSEISADWGAQRVKGVSIKEIIKNAIFKNREKETSLIEEFLYPKYGPGQLWELLAQKIEKSGGKIQKGCRVEKIFVNKNNVTAVEYIQDGKVKKEKADIFFSSMPLKDLVVNIQDDNKKIKKIAQGLVYRDFITIGLLVDKLQLENKTNIKTLGNIIPDCWIYVQEPDVKMCRIQIFNNWSPYLVEKPEKNIWIGIEYVCDENDEIWKMSKEEFKEFAINELEKIKILKKEDIKDYHIEKINKAYPAYFDSYYDIDKIIKYINKFKNLYCIGRNGQHRYNNMDHSMLTAIEAVNNLKQNKKDKSNIWNVNTEKQYHETKV